MGYAVCRIRSPMRWAAGTQMPRFNDEALSISQVSYRVRACVVHMGERVTCGHYRAVLITGNDEGNRFCNDGRKSVPLRCFDDVASDASCSRSVIVALAWGSLNVGSFVGLRLPIS